MLTNEIVVILHFQMQQKPSAFSRDKPCDKIKYTLFFFLLKLVLVLMLGPILVSLVVSG